MPRHTLDPRNLQAGFSVLGSEPCQCLVKQEEAQGGQLQKALGTGCSHRCSFRRSAVSRKYQEKATWTYQRSMEGREWGNTCQLQDSIETSSILGACLSKAGGSLQVRLHLVLNLQLAHASSSLQMVEVNQLIWLSLGLGVLHSADSVSALS